MEYWFLAFWVDSLRHLCPRLGVALIRFFSCDSFVEGLLCKRLFSSMISRRSFIHLVSWGAASAFISPPTTTTESVPTPKQSAPAPSTSDASFDYRVSTVSGIIEYASWNLQKSYDGIVLHWRTSTEASNQGFSIEHQGPEQDATDWTTLDFVESEGGWAESTDYRYVVSDPTPGAHRFRLREKHEDDDVHRTRVVSIQASGFLNWNAERSHEGIVLRWQTAAEYKNEGFALQRAPRGQDEWETLDFVEGQGTTSSSSSYSYVASGLSPGPHRFRLKKVRENGDTEYTDSISSLASGISTWEAEKNEEGIVLRWTTAAEYENDEFNIQHTSAGQKNWETLDSVGSVDEEDGTTSSPNNYQYLVSDLPPGAHRFRLKQVDKKKDVQYTDPISVRARGISKWTANKNEDTDTESVVLQWTTAAEYQNDGFAVQHTGPEQEEWEILKFIDGENTTSSSTEYRYVASDLRPGAHRFRLKKVNKTGDVEYTPTITNRISGIMEWKADKTNEGVELQWRTAVPENDEAYVVEHQSPDDLQKDWTPIKQIENQSSKDQTKDHSYTATDLVPGTHQFRLRHIEKDGTADRTEPVSIHRKMEKAIRFTPPSPNPVRTQATLSFAVRDKQPVTITIYDILGQEVKTVYRGTPSPEENQIVRFDVSGLASGAYFVRLVANEHVETHRCTVVR